MYYSTDQSVKNAIKMTGGIVHDNQRECGDLIKKAFDIEGFPYILLLAQMQMGKSGTYWYVIFEMLFDTTNGIDKIIVISGNREKDLYNQVKSDFKQYTAWYIKNKTNENALRREMKQKCEDNIEILWGAHLSSKKKSIYKVQDNSLIVWDEAHYAQSKDNSPDFFFTHNNLQSLINGSIDKEEITKRNIKLLTVSATPFSELLSQSMMNEHSSSNSIRKVVKLIPSDTYCGMESYMKRHKIKPSFRIEENTYSELTQLINKYKDTSNPKYMLIRTNDNKENQDLVKQACDECEVICKIFNSQVKEIEMEDLEEEPSRPTVVVVSGMLRMGKVVPKTHVAMVFESATKANGKKTDTGLQGLLGRMCGYAPDEHGFDIDIHIEEDLIEQVQLYLDGYDSPQGPQNTHAMNLRKTKKIQRRTATSTVFKLEDNESFHSKKGGINADVVSKWLRDNLDQLGMEDLSNHEAKVTRDEILNGTLKFKNLHSKCNKLLSDHLTSGVREIALNIPQSSYFVCKKKGDPDCSKDVWLIVRRYQETIEYTKEDGNDIFFNIEKKCVYKPII